MKKASEFILNEMQSKCNAYAALLLYRLLNLPVNAEPASLLSLSISDDEGAKHAIDEVAKAFQPNPLQLEIIPNSGKEIFHICKALTEVHPEYKQEVIEPEDENRLYNDDPTERHILITAPPVDKNRYDVLMDAVDVQYNECLSNIEKVNSIYKQKEAKLAQDMSPDDIKELDDAFEETYDTHKKMIDGYRANKEQEIETAYQKYLAEQEAKERNQQEMDMAHNEQAAQSMKLDSYDDN
ncbi:MAG: ribosome recycling factor [Bacteroidales bacterium]|nr:ribosome recycling factor [Bacteroidales bacterium]